MRFLVRNEIEGARPGNLSFVTSIRLFILTRCRLNRITNT